ncbi:MAG: PduL/EutD family phosphate acyltransferase [Patescibacteria group bacterium]
MNKKVEIEVSARHVHLAKDDFELLFGKDAKFEQVHELNQSGEFSTDKKVTIIGPDGSLEARFLSPFRKRTQVELSLTDCHTIGINSPYEINVFDGAASVIIRGPLGEIERKSAIVAKRHLHLNPNEARELNIKDGQEITAIVQTDRGRIIFDNITSKIAANFNLRVHLDTDEGNAAGIKGKANGEIIL